MKLKSLLLLAIAALPFQSMAAVIKTTGPVETIRLPIWAGDRSCFKVDGIWFKLDLTTAHGKAAQSLIQHSHASKTPVVARWHDTEPLEGGCDTATTVHPLYSLTFSE